MGRRHEALADEIHVRMRSLSEQPPDGCFCCAVHAVPHIQIHHRIACFIASHRLPAHPPHPAPIASHHIPSHTTEFISVNKLQSILIQCNCIPPLSPHRGQGSCRRPPAQERPKKRALMRTCACACSFVCGRVLGAKGSKNEPMLRPKKTFWYWKA